MDPEHAAAEFQDFQVGEQIQRFLTYGVLDPIRGLTQQLADRGSQVVVAILGDAYFVDDVLDLRFAAPAGTY